MSDFYTYRREINARRRRRRLAAFLAVMLGLAVVAAGFYLNHRAGLRQTQATAETALPAVRPAPDSASETAQASATPAPPPAEPAAPVGADPQRLLPAVDNAVWDTCSPVEQTIDTEYLNTDHRMVALPANGTVTDRYFDTVTFVGDSIASGLGIYGTGIQNARYATYTGASVNSFVNNVSMTNAVTKVTETPQETIVSTQPDAVYILVGTNNMVTQGNEEGFLAYYERLIDLLREQLSPGVEIYIQSIPGVQEDVVTRKPGLDNARIQTVNDMLANLALRKDCRFVNIREVLTNPDGSMVDAYDANYDGIHFNPTGYRVWKEYLYTHTAWRPNTVYSGRDPLKIFGAGS